MIQKSCSQTQMVSGQKSEWTKVRVIKCRTFVHLDFCPMTGQVETGRGRERVLSDNDSDTIR